MSIGTTSNVNILLRERNLITFDNTAVETTIGRVTVPGRALATNKELWVEIVGTYLNNSAATQTIRLRASFGGTLMYDAVSGTIASATGTRIFRFLGRVIQVPDDPPIQRHFMMAGVYGASAPTVGTGSFVSGQIDASFRGIDTDLNVNVDREYLITFTHAAAHAQVQCTRHALTAFVL